MTKVRLTRAVSKASGLSLAEAATCVDTIIDTIGEIVSRGERVELRGLGTFYAQGVREKRTGVAGIVPPHNRIMFRPCRKLREAVWNLGEGKT